MTGTLNILDAITALAAREVSELREIYIDEVPTDFVRPCLLIQAVTTTRRSGGANVLHITEYFTLTVYDRTDDYDRSSTLGLLELRERVLALFRPGYLRVDDRAVSVQASTGGRDRDKAFLDLQLEFYDTRHEPGDPGPMMEHIHTRLHKKG